MRAASRPPGAIALPSRFNFPCGAPCRLLYLRSRPVSEGDFNEAGRFVHFPDGDLYRMSEYLRRLTIKFFLSKVFISARISMSLINWRPSRFSVDASVRIPAFFDQAPQSLSQSQL